MVPRRFPTVRVRSTVVISSLLFGLSLAAAGCVHTPLVAPSGTVITLLPTTNVLPANGSTDIVALLIEGGAPPSTGTGATPAAAAGTPVHNGTVVSFTTTLGRVEPAEAKTNAGQVTVKLIADGRSGVATVTAYSGGATKTLTINVGAAAATRISVTATPQSLPANGGTATVTALVGDQQGNPIGSVPVSFSTSQGSVSQPTVITDNFGLASTQVTVGPASAAGNITVTATAGGGVSGSGLSGNVVLTIASAGTVTLTPPSSITVGVPVTFTVAVGSTVRATNVVIDFGDGTPPFDLGPISSSTPIAHTYSQVRSYVVSVTARFVDGTSQTLNNTVTVTDYSVSATCPGNTTLGSTSTFTVSIQPTVLSIDRVVWDFFGEDPAQQQTGLSVSHTWQSRGTKRIQYTVYPTSAPPKSAIYCQLEVN